MPDVVEIAGANVANLVAVVKTGLVREKAIFETVAIDDFVIVNQGRVLGGFEPALVARTINKVEAIVIVFFLFE